MTTEKAPSLLFSVRFLTAIISFLGYGVQYIQRVNMSTAIVCMLNHTAIKEQMISTSLLSTSLQNDMSFNTTYNTTEHYIETGPVCHFKELVGKEADADGPFVWSRNVQGLILSAYFYGYLTTQVAGGYLSLILGAKITLFGAIMIGSIFTLLAPLAASWSYGALVACRFMTGFSHGAFWPSMSSLWAHWAPPHERSRLVGTANAGSQIGNVFSFSIGGYLCVNGFAGGWPSIFYVFGTIGIVWSILWLSLTSKSPADHHFISEKEREYVLKNTKGTSVQQKKTPFIGILKSGSYWGLVFAHFSSNFGTYLFLTQLPTYMKEVLKFDIKSSGGLSALPFIVFWFIILLSGYAGDRMMKCGYSRETVRKLFNTLGLILPAISVVGLCFVTCATPYIGVALLVIGLSTTGAGYGAGFMINYNDIAGPYAGLVFGMVNTFGTMPGFIAPALVGILTPNALQSEWRNVFIITIVVYVIGAIGYCILGKAETEPYAQTKAENADEIGRGDEDLPLGKTSA